MVQYSPDVGSRFGVIMEVPEMSHSNGNHDHPHMHARPHPPCCQQAEAAEQNPPLTQRLRQSWLFWLAPILGLFSLVWFLLRVIPKPSRAAYPCQRVAMPLASGFVV